MSIFDTIMGKATQAKTQQAAQEAPPTQPSADTAAPEAPVNPLSQFNDMAQAAQPAEDTTSQDAPSPFELHPDNLSKAAAALDISKYTKPEEMQAALNGDVGAFTTILNNVVRLAFMSAAHQAADTARAGVGHELTKFDKSMAGKIRDMSTESELSADPRLADAAFQPVIKAILPIVKQANPKASASKLKELTLQYLDALSAKDSPAPARSSGQSQLNFDAIHG